MINVEQRTFKKVKALHKVFSPSIKFYFFVERGLPGVLVIEGVWETEADTCHTHVQGGNFRRTEDWLPELLIVIRIVRKPLSPEKRGKNIDYEQYYFLSKLMHKKPNHTS